MKLFGPRKSHHPREYPSLFRYRAARAALVAFGIVFHDFATAKAGKEGERTQPILGLTGTVSDIKTAVLGREVITTDQPGVSRDLDLKQMAAWALNYLIRTPRQDLGYEPVFQCAPLECPPVPEGQDPIVACDTDARMDWEWYYMRDITGSARGRDVEAAFHKRVREYIDPE